MTLASVMRRAARLLLVLGAISIVTFGLLAVMPGDPALALLGPGATDAAVAEVRASLGLDRPLIVRYGDWLLSALGGDLGTSYQTGQPVVTSLADRFPLSIELVLVSQIVALAVAVPVGLWSARRPGGIVDRICSVGGLGLLSLPMFALGSLLVYVFAVTLKWLPATGIPSFGDDPLGHVQGLILPVLSLAGWQFAMYAQILRGEARTVLAEDYIETAVLKGLPTRAILLRHTLKPASLSLASLVPITTGELIGGAVVVETLYALPGVGRLMVDAIAARDLLVLQGAVLAVAVVFVMLNLFADVVVRWLDPRIRSHHAG
ncbi:ABC transporter permease [Rhizohabitans arisaemae]|uniref:ABC transporter permease n=1 Tax=Rhizohabitans arisaemae TaxID=2720610 RepID=UPI0024B1B8C8|nr:ABC transporter permease [Rhizohabitans arisaemae]